MRLPSEGPSAILQFNSFLEGDDSKEQCKDHISRFGLPCHYSGRTAEGDWDRKKFYPLRESCSIMNYLRKIFAKSKLGKQKTFQLAIASRIDWGVK